MIRNKPWNVQVVSGHCWRAAGTACVAPSGPVFLPVVCHGALVTHTPVPELCLQANQDPLVANIEFVGVWMFVLANHQTILQTNRVIRLFLGLLMFIDGMFLLQKKSQG